MALQMTWHPSLHRRKNGPPLGLRNLGNTCYLNSVLQCLTYTPPLANFCLRNQHSDICQKLDANRKRDNCPFCVLEKRIARSLNLDAAIDAPSKIGNFLRLYAEHFQWGRQEDAHEFLRYVIDACHNTCLRLLKVSGAVGVRAPGKGGSDGDRGRTIVKEIFGGALLSQVKCLSCGAESNKTDDIMDISLDLYQSNSLKDALRRFFQPEVLDGDNKYKCESCKKLSAARKQMFIHQAPNVLVIQLKRFEGINGGKINKDIAFEEALFLNSFMLKPSKDPQSEYSLFGSIVHSGYSPESGHYYAYVKDPTGQWYCCNDAHVSLSTTQDVLSEKVYILFYLCSTSNKRTTPLKNGFHNCEMKFPNANGKTLSKPQKYSGIKSLPLTNGTVSPVRAISSSLKSNGAVATDTKLENLRKHENKMASVNGNGHMRVKDALVEGEATNVFEHASISGMGKASSMGVSSDISSNGRYQTVGASNGLLNHDNSDQAGNLPSVRQNGKVKFSLVHSRLNNHNKVENLQRHGNNTSSSMINGSHDQKSAREGGKVVGEKRKSVDAEDSEGRQTPHAGCSKSSSRDGRSDKHSILEYNQPPGSLEKLKQLLAQETSANLRSSGWYAEVKDFMHAQKRICSNEVTDSPNHLKLRLVAEAKKVFVSRLPENLKGRLVRELKSFSERKPLSEL